MQERAVALVGLGHEVLAGAVVGVGADLGDLAADDERRVEPGVLQDQRDHRGGGGLAVGAGDRDRCAGRSSPRRAPPSGAAPAARGRAPRPAPGGRPGWRWSRRPCRHRRGWTPRGACGWCRRAPAAPASAGHSAQLAAGDRDAPGEQQPGQAAHADPADADQVHACPGPRRSAAGRVMPVHASLAALARPRPARSRAQRLVAVAPAVPRPRPRSSRPAGARSRTSGTTVRSIHSGVSSASSTSRPPPASTTGSALRRCSPLPYGSGT